MEVWSGPAELARNTRDVPAAFIASGGLPMPTVLAAAVGALELFGGLALVVGYQVRLALALSQL